MTKKRLRIYIGNIVNRKGEIFKSETRPTRDSHGDKYSYCLGPFKTMRAAKYYLNNGGSENPHLTYISQIENAASNRRAKKNEWAAVIHGKKGWEIYHIYCGGQVKASAKRFKYFDDAVSYAENLGYKISCHSESLAKSLE